MTMVKQGKKGRVSIPKSVLRRLGLEGEVPLLVEATADGAILLRLAGVYPIETYSDERISEFDAAADCRPSFGVRGLSRRSSLFHASFLWL